MVLTRDCTKTTGEPQRRCPADSGRDGQALHSKDACRAEQTDAPGPSPQLGAALTTPQHSQARNVHWAQKLLRPKPYLFSELTVKQRACFSTVLCSYMSQ